MELHTKQLQICMNSAVAAQLTQPPKMQGCLTGRRYLCSKTKEITL